MLFRKYFYHIHFLYMLSDLNRFLKVNKISPMTTKKARTKLNLEAQDICIQDFFYGYYTSVVCAQMKSVQTFTTSS